MLTHGVANPRDLDPWFWSHYRDAAGIVLELVPAECLREGRSVIDFGCGDGATALGVASNARASVIGVDLCRSFDSLPELAVRTLGTRLLPPNLSFRENTEAGPLPFPDACVDLVYSWSVFEHLADVRSVLAELQRIVKRGGTLFIQIEPLFHSPYGSHLRRLVDEPWAHLSRNEDDYLALAAAARDTVPASEQDVLYRTYAFEEVKGYLIAEYKRLNRITAGDLLAAVTEEGFTVVWTKLLTTDLSPPEALLARHARELLVTDQVVLLATRT